VFRYLSEKDNRRHEPPHKPREWVRHCSPAEDVADVEDIPRHAERNAYESKFRVIVHRKSMALLLLVREHQAGRVLAALERGLHRGDVVVLVQCLARKVEDAPDGRTKLRYSLRALRSRIAVRSVCVRVYCPIECAGCEEFGIEHGAFDLKDV